MAIVILEHEVTEHPGIFAHLLRDCTLPCKTIKLYRGDVISLSTAPDGVLIMGGPMNVYEEDRYPFLIQENSFIRQCLAEHIPMLGICLGAQLIAKAAGATVTKAPVREVGWFEVSLTDAGVRDPLLQGLNTRFFVFQFHEDIFAIPAEAEHIITAAQCPNQGFRIGKYIYGLQFHLEATATMIEEWIADEGQSKSLIQKDTYNKISSCHRTGELFFKRFIALCMS